MPFVATQTDLEIIILSEVSHTKEDRYYITYMWNLKKQTQIQEKAYGYQRGKKGRWMKYIRSLGLTYAHWWSWFSLYVMSDSCDSTACSPPCSSVHGILQARRVVAIPFSRGSSRPRNQIRVSCIAGNQLSFYLLPTELSEGSPSYMHTTTYKTDYQERPTVQ